MELMVEEMRREALGVLSLTLVDPGGGELPAWEPGAHVDLSVGDLVRQYSLCGSPGDRHRYRVAVLHVDRSRGGSAHIHEELRPGDLVEVGGPRNHFELVAGDDYLFIAGGIGITPLMSMIEAVDRAGRSWRLVYGGRTLGSMAFVERLRAYGDRVVLVPADDEGMLDLPALLAGPARGLVYACGPEPMLEAIEALCEPWPEGSLRLERFTPKAVDHAEDGSFEVVCQTTGTTVRVEPGVSIVDALETVDVWLPTACREGMCGTCETRVIEGTLDHRDSLLTAEERSCGKTMLPCVSRCTSVRLVLDI